MSEKTIPDEAAIIQEILQRRGSKQARIPAEKMKSFKAKIGAEIERTGKLNQEFVDDLLQQLNSGEL